MKPSRHIMTQPDKFVNAEIFSAQSVFNKKIDRLSSILSGKQPPHHIRGWFSKKWHTRSPKGSHEKSPLDDHPEDFPCSNSVHYIAKFGSNNRKFTRKLFCCTVIDTTSRKRQLNSLQLINLLLNHLTICSSCILI